jgi:hypothetical protein
VISFTTNYGDDNLLHLASLKTAHQIGMGLHFAALAALVGDVELASRLRHRARNREIEDRISREREAAWGCPGLVDTDQGSAVVSVRAQVYSCS